jgi:putative sigma-54 modulation protein
MKIQIQSPHFKASKALTDKVREKVLTLEKLEQKIERADVTLTLDHKGGNLAQTCQILLSVKGKDIFAKVKANSFEEAINLSIDTAKRRLRKRKTKYITRALTANKLKTA